MIFLYHSGMLLNNGVFFDEDISIYWLFIFIVFKLDSVKYTVLSFIVKLLYFV